MTWGKMDDKFHRNRKIRELRRSRNGREAIGLWCFCWSWCLDDPELTGVVPADELDDRDKKCASLLVSVGLWTQLTDGYAFHDFHVYNPTKAQIEAKKEYDRTFVSAKRQDKSATVVYDSETTRERLVNESDTSRAPRALRTQPNLINSLSPNGERSVEVPSSVLPSGPSVRKQIEILESTYPNGLPEQARLGCGLTRQNGKLADTVWLRTLQALAQTGVHAIEAMRIYVEKYANGEKDERYLIGIARGLQRGGKNSHAPRIGMIPPGKHEDFITDMSDLDRAIGEL